jgi:hypothetical protein
LDTNPKKTGIASKFRRLAQRISAKISGGRLDQAS